MNPAHDPIFDQFEPESPEVDSGKRLTTWYAQGQSDGFGDRLLMFDNTSAPSWEIIRFKPALAHDSRFETALRQRVEQLSSFQHPAFPLVRPIKKLGQEDGLAVVSTYATGVCLADALKKPRGAEFAIQFLRQLVPALAALQEHALGMAHGALTVDRIILTPEGQLMIREHMVGSALESLQLPAARLWVEFGVLALAKPTATAELDARTDIVQLALVAVSLMAGRRIGPDEYPDKVAALLDDIARRHLGREPIIFRSLRHWLDRALQLSARPFNSARDAEDALADLEDEPQHADRSADAPLLLAPPVDPVALGTDVDTKLAPSDQVGPSVLRRAGDEPAVVAAGPALTGWRRAPRVIRWAAIGVGLLAVVEAVFIGRLLLSKSGAQPAVATQPVSTPTAKPDALTLDRPPPLTPMPTVAVARVDPNVPVIGAAKVEPQVVVKATERPGDVVQALSASPRSGGFRVSSPIEFHVLEGERVLGSSLDGAIVITAGQHEFEFVNNVIGYRVRQMVNIQPGHITPLSVTVPNGSLNINATPWANVWIDGNAYGETPLGNVSIVPGEHDVVFRHPNLGERRQKVLVRPDALTRVVENFQQ